MIPRRRLIDRSVQERDARLYFLIVEGEKTEPAYFYALEENSLIPRNRVKLHVYSPDRNASAPSYLLRKADEVITSHFVGLDDEVWLIFDVDLHSGSNRLTQVIQSSKDASQRGWAVAISNPCFEVWLLLHVSNDLTNINEYGDSVEAALRSELGGYDKCRTPGQCLNNESLSHAMERARQGDIDPASPVPRFPGTRVYKLFESIFRTQAPRQRPSAAAARPGAVGSSDQGPLRLRPGTPT